MIVTDQVRRILTDSRESNFRKLKKQASDLTRQYFGRTIILYAPLYLGNYCENNCVYCGFSSHHKIPRTRLNDAEFHKEMNALSKQGIQNILILTGESDRMTSVDYIKNAVAIARQYFPNVSIEIQPLLTDEYRELIKAGVDGLAVYQETYNRRIYDAVHVSGKKKDYDFRYETPERAACAGMRSISMGILLGLAPPVEDVIALFQHLRFMEKMYPGVEYSLSFPRIVPVEDMDYQPIEVSDEIFVKIICLARILFPRVGINLSTREQPAFRDDVLPLVTRMSAGSSTLVGGYTHIREGEPQFDIHDHRSVKEIVQLLKDKNYDPVFTEWRCLHEVSGSRVQTQP